MIRARAMIWMEDADTRHAAGRGQEIVSSFWGSDDFLKSFIEFLKSSESQKLICDRAEKAKDRASIVDLGTIARRAKQR